MLSRLLFTILLPALALAQCPELISITPNPLKTPGALTFRAKDTSFGTQVFMRGYSPVVFKPRSVTEHVKNIRIENAETLFDIPFPDLGSKNYQVGFVLRNSNQSECNSTGINVLLSNTASNNGKCKSITRHQITWTFDKEYDCGTFANGDPWVVGPVVVESIFPPSMVVLGRTINGSQVNPKVNGTNIVQGFDSTMYGQYGPAFSAALNVADNLPLTLAANTSLVSTESEGLPNVRPQVKTASVLTVLSFPAPSGSFRPGYSGNDKTIPLNENEIDCSTLPSLALPSSAPSIQSVSAKLEKLWFGDFIAQWPQRHLHPTQNMPDYGREMTAALSEAASMLISNYSCDAKKELLIRYLQIAIDQWAIFNQPGGLATQPSGGGHHSGRCWPIVMTGLVTHNSDMAMSILNGKVSCNEITQTFLVDKVQGTYGPEHLGLPEWGSKHDRQPEYDSRCWNGTVKGKTPDTTQENKYRTCCNANVWWGEHLAMLAMGARGAFKNDAFTNYMDRYFDVATTNGQAGWTMAWDQWVLDFWKMHRDKFGNRYNCNVIFNQNICKGEYNDCK